MSRLSLNRVLFLFLLLPLLVRLWSVGQVRNLSGDEGMNVPAAQSYAERGVLTSGYWAHPPLGPVILGAGMRVFGDNPYGWRMPAVVFGSLSVLLVFLLLRGFLDDERTAVLAAVFLAVDPLHITFSRTTHEEIQTTFFFLCALYGLMRFLRGSRPALLAAGLGIGFCIATRWYYVLPLALICLLVCLRSFRAERPGLPALGYIFSCLVLLPATVYLLPYYSWFSRGYTLADFLVLQTEALKTLRMLALGGFTRQGVLGAMGEPWQWFLKPLATGLMVREEGNWAQYFFLMNNPPVLLLTIPSAGYLCYRAVRDRIPRILLPPAILVVTYLQFLLTSRPIFFYSLLVLLPFAYAVVADAAVRLLARYRSPWAFRAVVALAVVWGAYCYPLATQKMVPSQLYAPVLALGQIIRPF